MRVEQERGQVVPGKDSAEKLHVAQQEIRKTPLMHGVEERLGTPIEVLFYEQYWGERRSLQDIARLIERPWSTAYSWAHKLGITIRSLSEAVRVSWAHPEQRRSQRKYFEVRNAFDAGTDEDLKEKLMALYRQEGSQKNMVKRIRSMWNIGVSETTMRRWMKGLGIEVKKRGVGRWLRQEKIRNAVQEAFGSGAFSRLSDREQTVLKLRYLEGKTLEECGRELSVTREWIRQIEAKALEKLGIGN